MNPSAVSPSSSDGPLVRVEGVRKAFRRRSGTFFGSRQAVWAVAGLNGEGVSLTVDRGETLAVVGESGSGKSTLGRLILGLLRPDEGRIWFGSTEVTSAHGKGLFDLRARMQMVFQDPYSSLNPRRTVLDTIAQPLRLHSVVPGREVGRRAHELLELVGLTPAAQFGARYPHELSGGQRQRVAIARALASNPKLLVADEPIASLDVSVRATVLEVLRNLRETFDLSMLFISHDLGVVRSIADRVAVMYLGRIVEIGPTESVLTNPQHPYTEALLAAAPVPDPAHTRNRDRRIVRGEIPSPATPPQGCTFHTRCAYAFDLCRRAEPALYTTPSSLSACHLRAEARPAGHGAVALLGNE